MSLSVFNGTILWERKEWCIIGYIAERRECEFGIAFGHRLHHLQEHRTFRLLLGTRALTITHTTWIERE